MIFLSFMYNAIYVMRVRENECLNTNDDEGDLDDRGCIRFHAVI